MTLLKKAAGFILRTSISIVLLVFLFTRIDMGEVWRIIASSRLIFLSLAAGLSVAVYFLCLVRWRMILRSSGIVYPLRRLLIPFLGGTFLNTFLPSTIGGDILRSAHVARDTRMTAGSVAAVLMDRLSGFIGVVIVAVAALCLGGRSIASPQVTAAVLLLAAILVAVCVVVFHPAVYRWTSGLVSRGNPGKLRQTIGQTITELHNFRGRREVLRKSIALSLLIQGVSPLGALWICAAVGGRVDPVYFFVLMPVIGAIALLPVSIGGLGIRDALVVFAFSRAGLSQDTAMAMSLVNSGLAVFFACLSGVIYVFALYSRRIQPDKA